MGNIGATMLLEDVTVKLEQVLQPKKETKDFAEILALLLGQASFPVDKLLENALVEKEDVLESELEQNDLLLGVLNPGVAEEPSDKVAELISKEAKPWLKYVQQNITLKEGWEKPAMEAGQLYEKAEQFLQQQSLSLKELTFLQEIKDKTGPSERQENFFFTTLEKEIPEEKLVKEERLITENKLANLSDREVVKGSEEVKIVKQEHFRAETPEIKKMFEEVASLKNEVTHETFSEKEIESWVQLFSTRIDGNVESGSEELRLSTVNLVRDLPELVLAELKTFEQANGSKDVIIHLEPKELGKLVVKLTSEEGVVSVKFVAHYPVTRNLLESGLDSLRQSFIEQDIPFASLDVELGGQQLEQSQYQQQQLLWPEERKYQERSGDLENSYEENILAETEPDGLLKLGAYEYLV